MTVWKAHLTSYRTLSSEMLWQLAITEGFTQYSQLFGYLSDTDPNVRTHFQLKDGLDDIHRGCFQSRLLCDPKSICIRSQNTATAVLPPLSVLMFSGKESKGNCFIGSEDFYQCFHHCCMNKVGNTMGEAPQKCQQKKIVLTFPSAQGFLGQAMGQDLHKHISAYKYT